MSLIILVAAVPTSADVLTMVQPQPSRDLSPVGPNDWAASPGCTVVHSGTLQTSPSSQHSTCLTAKDDDPGIRGDQVVTNRGRRNG
jgi:hypothetical protein